MVLQPLTNGIIAGSAIGLMALSFGLISGTTKFFHFAHGATYTIGAYLAFVFSQQFGPAVGIVAGITGAGLLGAGMELGVYRQLRRANSPSLILFISSLGLLIVLQNAVSLIMGDGTKVLGAKRILQGIDILGASITAIQIAVLGVSLSAFLLVWYTIHLSRIGLWIRAVANDPDLATIYGVPTDRVILLTFILGSALAGIAGISIGYDTDLTPGMGFHALLMGVVASIIGGIGSIPGALLGGLLIGIIQHLSAWWFSTEWQSAIIFSTLILFLLVRPQGVFGKPLSRGTI